MSYQRITVIKIKCDKCSNVFTTKDLSLKDSDKKARKNGWSITKNKDLCPLCYSRKETKMISSIERAHKLMSAFKKGEDLTREELIYLYALYLLYRDIGIKLHDTHMINCYCNDILSEIEEKLNDHKSIRHTIDYAMIINEQKALEYIIKFERKYIN